MLGSSQFLFNLQDFQLEVASLTFGRFIHDVSPLSCVRCHHSIFGTRFHRKRTVKVPEDVEVHRQIQTLVPTA
jgi:hypothetical protein